MPFSPDSAVALPSFLLSFLFLKKYPNIWKNTYNEIREKSLFQWLDEMEKHEDIAVRGGVKLTREYIQHLKDENKRLEEQNKLKNEYLKKVVGR